MRSSGLFGGLFVPEAVGEATSDRAWVQAMLDFEAALARAEAEVGVIPSEAAAAIAAACAAERFDPDSLGVEARAAGNPVVPLVKRAHRGRRRGRRRASFTGAPPART